MTRRILTALTAISFVLLVFAAPQSAQERQVGNRTPIGDRSQDQRQIVNVADAEKLRSDLSAAYIETEAMIRFLAEFEVARQSSPMKDYEAICDNMAKERKRIEGLSAVEIMVESRSFPDAKALGRIIEVSQKIRTDEGLYEVMKKAERYFQEGKLRSSVGKAPAAGIRNVIAAPAFLDPVCQFDNPRNYPSGGDVAVANGLAIAAQVVYESLPDSFSVAGFSAPNVFRIAMVIAWGVLAEIVNGFQGAQWDGQWCEAFQQYVQDSLSADEGFVALLMTDPYLDLVRRVVDVALTKALADGVAIGGVNPPQPTNCGRDRYNEGLAATARLDKYKKFRAAYQNIGAANCVQ